jgi:hypothetical protein
LKKNFKATAIGAAALLIMVPIASAQQRGIAETSLVGIKLYDTGQRVISVFGTPAEIQAVNVGGGAVGPAGGPATGGPGGGGRTGAPGMGGGGPGGAAAPTDFRNSPWGFGDEMLRQMAPGPVPAGPGGPGGGGPGPGGPGGGPPMPGGPGGGAPGGGGAGTSDRVLFTRWVYNTGGSRYGFVLDKANRVVQIEAIGLQNQRVRTSQGIGFGSNFGQIIQRYGAPDGYEVGGDTIVVRYLVRRNVAFRLSRLGRDRPHVVTGVVVAAGKT